MFKPEFSYENLVLFVFNGLSKSAGSCFFLYQLFNTRFGEQTSLWATWRKKNWRRDLLQQLEFCTCILLLLVMKPHNMELEEMGISVKVILSAKNVLGLACTYLYSFLKIPSWNIATASAFCLPRFVQMLFKVMQLK